MEYNYQNSIDGFRVKYTLVTQTPIPSDKLLTKEESAFLQELEDTYADIEQLTNQADGYDYALAVSSGIIAGVIDSFFVGEWDFKDAKKLANIEINQKIIRVAKKDPRYEPWCNGIGHSGRWKNRDPNRLASAVEFLEEKYPLPGDSEWNFKGSGISTVSHHLDDLCHHPTLVGLLSSILVQFTGTAKYRRSEGDLLSLPVSVNTYGCFVSDAPFGKVFAGVINWFFQVAQTINNQKGHLMSDMAGSISTVKKGGVGAGVPGTVMSTLKELSALPCFRDTAFSENLRKAFQNGIGSSNNKLNLGVFNSLFEGASSKFDMRTEAAVAHELKRQAVPVIMNEVVVRAFYFIRRFIEQIKKKQSILELDWKALLPFNNRTIVRMMTIATGAFTVADLGDAAIRAGMESCGAVPVFISKFILRVNFVGVGRFAVAVSADLYMEARKGRLEIAAASGEVAAAAIAEKQAFLITAEQNANTDKKVEKMRLLSEEVANLKF